MKVDRLKEFLNYNSETGEVTYKKTNKSVYPDEDGLVIMLRCCAILHVGDLLVRVQTLLGIPCTTRRFLTD